MPANIDIKKWIIAGILIFHIAWIGNHMRWELNERINPWKLGGYAMYTSVNPLPGVRLYEPVSRERIKADFVPYEAATLFTNGRRAFRCASVPPRALVAFFKANTDLIGKSLVFVYSERQLFRDPLSTKRVTVGVLFVTWQGAEEFSYTSNFCGNEDRQFGILS